MPIIIDGHQDIAYNMLTFGRDYRRSAVETRQLEAGGVAPTVTGHTLLGWPEYQRGQVAVIFATLFIPPKKYAAGMWDQLAYNNLDEAAHLLRGEYDLYRRLADDSPEKFSLVRSHKDLQAVLAPWEQSPADYPNTTHPVGLVLLLEGAEGLRAPDELEEWWHMGLRMVGPVWAGTRFCGGSYEPGSFTPEGRELLEVMGSLGYTLDIAHMTEESALQALDQYEGPVVATHANARALLKGDESERHLSNRQIQRLLDRDGLIGILPFNRFLKPSWSPGDDPASVTLEHVAAHIDHICQMAGDALHVGIGTDFDGGFGYGAVPQGIDTIADMQKLVPVLQARGYAPADIDNILNGNWRKFLERTLPES